MYQTNVEVLNDRKTIQKNELHNSCSTIVMNGKEFNYTNKAGEVSTIHLGGGEEIAILLQNKAQACKAQNIDYSISDVVTNEIHTMSADEGVSLSNEVMIWGSSQWEKKKLKQNLVEACQTVESVLSITWESVE